MADKKYFLDIPALSRYSELIKSIFAKKSDTGASVELSLDTNTYVLTFSLKNNAGEIISSQSIDFPIESVVMSARYDVDTKSIILTLKSGEEIYVPLGDLVDGLQNEITEDNKLSADLIESGLINVVFTADDKTLLDSAIQIIESDNDNAVITRDEETKVVHIEVRDPVIEAKELVNDIKNHIVRKGGYEFSPNKAENNPVDISQEFKWVRIGTGLSGFVVDGNKLKNEGLVYDLSFADLNISGGAENIWEECEESQAEAKWYKSQGVSLPLSDSQNGKIYLKIVDDNMSLSFEDNTIILDSETIMPLSDIWSYASYLAEGQGAVFITENQMTEEDVYVCIDRMNRCSYCVKGTKGDLYGYVNGEWQKLTYKQDDYFGAENVDKFVVVNSEGHLVPYDAYLVYANTKEVNEAFNELENADFVPFILNENELCIPGNVSFVEIELSDGSVIEC